MPSAPGHLYNQQESGVVLQSVWKWHDLAGRWLWPMISAMLGGLHRGTIGAAVQAAEVGFAKGSWQSGVWSHQTTTFKRVSDATWFSCLTFSGHVNCSASWATWTSDT